MEEPETETDPETDAIPRSDNPIRGILIELWPHTLSFLESANM